MIPDRTVYTSPRLASAYAFERPAVHPFILQHVRETMRLDAPVDRALDIGCGAGLSTAALGMLARHVTGIDPAAPMLAHRHRVAPRASFVVAQAELLPFRDAAFDLITAAGSINYADRVRALPELARVLSRHGTLIIYDFSAGRRLAESVLLEEWFSEFARRYPDAPGYALDVRSLPYRSAGLALRAYDEFEVPLPMMLDTYVRYVMSEARVELACAAGASEADIREWCRLSLAGILDDRPQEVIFDAYAACIRPD